MGQNPFSKKGNFDDINQTLNKGLSSLKGWAKATVESISPLIQRLKSSNQRICFLICNCLAFKHFD